MMCKNIRQKQSKKNKNFENDLILETWDHIWLFWHSVANRPIVIMEHIPHNKMDFFSSNSPLETFIWGLEFMTECLVKAS